MHTGVGFSLAAPAYCGEVMLIVAFLVPILMVNDERSTAPGVDRELLIGSTTADTPVPITCQNKRLHSPELWGIIISRH